MATSEGIPSSIDIELLELNDNPYIAKELGGECTYLYTENLGNTEIPGEHRGVAIKKTCNTNQWKVFLQEIVSHSKDIDVLFLTGSSAVHMFATYLYKKRNPNGRVVVFGDMEPPQARERRTQQPACRPISQIGCKRG